MISGLSIKSVNVSGPNFALASEKGHGTAYNIVYLQGLKPHFYSATLQKNVRYTKNVTQNAASLERLNGVRILANGWRLSERLQPETNRRYF
jgi:hypothetical protein